MKQIIGNIVIFICIEALGVWYILAGNYGWKYPRIKCEYGNENEKMSIRFIKIVLGIVLVVCGIGLLVEMIQRW